MSEASKNVDWRTYLVILIMCKTIKKKREAKRVFYTCDVMMMSLRRHLGTQTSHIFGEAVCSSTGNE